MVVEAAAAVHEPRVPSASRILDSSAVAAADGLMRMGMRMGMGIGIVLEVMMI